MILTVLRSALSLSLCLVPLACGTEIPPTPLLDMTVPGSVLAVAESCRDVVFAAYRSRPACVADGTCMSFYQSAQAKAVNAVNSATEGKADALKELSGCVDWLARGVATGVVFEPFASQARVVCKQALAVGASRGEFCSSSF